MARVGHRQARGPLWLGLWIQFLCLLKEGSPLSEPSAGFPGAGGLRDKGVPVPTSQVYPPVRVSPADPFLPWNIVPTP